MFGKTGLEGVRKFMEKKRSYEAPKVHYIQFDHNDILTQSGWNFNCDQSGQGNNAEPPGCDVDLHTDNSQN